MEERV
jgi:hypothetical protein